LKSRLSEYLRRVRPGARITVLDHGRPIARLEPVAPGPRIAHRAAPGTRRAEATRCSLPPTLEAPH
jgi:prevent-host-death family protein